MKIASGEEVREFYESSADSYNSMMDTEIDLPMYATALSGLAERIAALNGAVLDSSCGSGHMLERLKEYTPGRTLLGIDLCPRMVAISRRRLGSSATVVEGDMRSLSHVAGGTCATVLSYFALHHVDLTALHACFVEWYRVLTPEGQLLVATWEGEGDIDYGSETDIVAMRYQSDEVTNAASGAGFRIDTCSVGEVEGMEMAAVYLAATK